VLVRDSAGTKMYLNGEFDTGNTNTTTLSNVTLSIGNSPYYTQYFDGNIDEVKIYDSAITATQVEALYMSKPSFTVKNTQVESPNLR
jgi:hypothetical protein